MNNLIAILLSFGKIGLLALGGGNSMIKLIEFESVSTQAWVSQPEFAGMVGSTFLFPGLTAVKLSALIGYKIAGIPGLMTAVLALNLPGLLLVMMGYRFLTNHNTPFAHKILVIFQYGAIALLAAATWSIAYDTFKVNHTIFLLGTTFIFFIAIARYDVSPFWGFLVFIGFNLVLI